MLLKQFILGGIQSHCTSPVSWSRNSVRQTQDAVSWSGLKVTQPLHDTVYHMRENICKFLQYLISVRVPSLIPHRVIIDPSPDLGLNLKQVLKSVF